MIPIAMPLAAPGMLSIRRHSTVHGARPPPSLRPTNSRHSKQHQVCSAVAEAVAPPSTAVLAAQGHSALLHSLGEVGDVSPSHLPMLLRLVLVKSKYMGENSGQALKVGRVALKVYCVACYRSHTHFFLVFFVDVEGRASR
jgi:hypothetical protein